MKKTIFNASLEESMNLVTDKYIQTAMEDINEKGYWRKIIGFFTVLFFTIVMFFLTVMLDDQGIYFFFVKPFILSAILMFFSAFIVLFYLIDTIKIKRNRILSYYFYNRDMFFMMSCLCFQVIILAISGAGLVLGPILSGLIYTITYVVVLLERYQWFKDEILESLYGDQTFENPLARFLDYFVIFSKKYGAIIMVLLIIFRFIFPINRDNDVLRTLGLVGYPFFMLIVLYFIIALGADNFQGYYVKKYLEEYRQLSGYSIEDWYGKKSKMYKESLKK